MTASWHEFAVKFFCNDLCYIRTEISGMANCHAATHIHTHISKCCSWLAGIKVRAILHGQDSYQYVKFLTAKFIVLELIWVAEREGDKSRSFSHLSHFFCVLLRVAYFII